VSLAESSEEKSLNVSRGSQQVKRRYETGICGMNMRAIMVRLLYSVLVKRACIYTISSHLPSGMTSSAPMDKCAFGAYLTSSKRPS
jgi:hypothetical protein